MQNKYLFYVSIYDTTIANIRCENHSYSKVWCIVET
jgi:hypothetical protein